jgi:hypothetical protein
MMATIPTLQIPQMGAVSGGADFSPLANLGNLYQKYQQDQADKAALATFQQTGDPRALMASGNMSLAQLGINAQNHLDTLKQQAIENKRADINLGLNQAAGARAAAAERRTAADWEKTPDPFATNPDGSIRDLYAEAAARAKANAIPENYEANPDYGKVEGAPKWRYVPGGPADPSVIATQAEAKTGGGMGDGAVELAARRLKEGDLSALTNIGRGAQASHDLGRIQNRMADILVKEDGLSMTDAAKKVSTAVQAFKASQVGQSAEARTGATREANLNLILKATDAAIPAALEASEKVARTGWVPLNKIIQKGQIVISDPDLMKLGMANLQLAEHWARAMNPTGVMRESDRDKALEFLSTATSKETYKALVEQLKTQITRERDAVKGAAPGTSSPYGAPTATPGGGNSPALDPLGIR